MTVRTDKLALGDLVQYLLLTLRSRGHVTHVSYLEELLDAWKVIPIHTPRRVFDVAVGTLLADLQRLEPFASPKTITTTLL